MENKFIKDKTGAILNTDITAFNSYKATRNKQLEQIAQINTLEARVTKLEEFIKNYIEAI